MDGPDTLVATAAYQPEPLAAAAARRFVRDTLQSWVVTGGDADGHGVVDDAVLLTSELVTNAVVHAGTPVQVTCRLADDNVEVVVRDSQPASLVPEPSGSELGATERTSGRGLLLPSALASAWGVTYGRTAKAVWFRIGLGGPGAALDEGMDGWADSSPAGPAALTVALRQALVTPDGRATRARRAATAAAAAAAPPGGDPGYAELLQRTAERARAAVRADAACVVLADEDGELGVRAAAGVMPTGAPPAVLTVPFVVDGRVTGLLTATKAQPESFRDGEAPRLQQIADRTGPSLERARLSDLDRLRRERLGVLAIARDLVAGDLGQDKVMALAGEAVVPRLAPWCAILLPRGDHGLRVVYARHLDEARTPALCWLLDRVCDTSAPSGRRLVRPEAGGAWQWQLAAVAGDCTAGTAPAGGTPGGGRPGGGRPGGGVPAGGVPAGGVPAGGVPGGEVPGGMPGGGAPAGAAALGADVAWCFPLAGQSGGAGALVLGSPQGERLPRDAAVLAADLAARLGLALNARRCRAGPDSIAGRIPAGSG